MKSDSQDILLRVACVALLLLGSGGLGKAGKVQTKDVTLHFVDASLLHVLGELALQERIPIGLELGDIALTRVTLDVGRGLGALQ